MGRGIWRRGPGGVRGEFHRDEWEGHSDTPQSRQMLGTSSPSSRTGMETTGEIYSEQALLRGGRAVSGLLPVSSIHNYFEVILDLIILNVILIFVTASVYV